VAFQTFQPSKDEVSHYHLHFNATEPSLCPWNFYAFKDIVLFAACFVISSILKMAFGAPFLC
jgi:hypothetical protein